MPRDLVAGGLLFSVFFQFTIMSESQHADQTSGTDLPNQVPECEATTNTQRLDNENPLPPPSPPTHEDEGVRVATGTASKKPLKGQSTKNGMSWTAHEQPRSDKISLKKTGMELPNNSTSMADSARKRNESTSAEPRSERNGTPSGGKAGSKNKAQPKKPEARSGAREVQCYICGQLGHKKNNCNADSDRKPADRQTCRICNSPDHFQNQCPAKKKTPTEAIAQQVKDLDDQAAGLSEAAKQIALEAIERKKFDKQVERNEKAFAAAIKNEPSLQESIPVLHKLADTEWTEELSLRRDFADSWTFDDTASTDHVREVAFHLFREYGHVPARVWSWVSCVITVFVIYLFSSFIHWRLERRKSNPKLVCTQCRAQRENSESYVGIIHERVVGDYEDCDLAIDASREAARADDAYRRLMEKFCIFSGLFVYLFPFLEARKPGNPEDHKYEPDCPLPKHKDLRESFAMSAYYGSVIILTLFNPISLKIALFLPTFLLCRIRDVLILIWREYTFLVLLYFAVCAACLWVAFKTGYLAVKLKHTYTMLEADARHNPNRLNDVRSFATALTEIRENDPDLRDVIHTVVLSYKLLGITGTLPGEVSSRTIRVSASVLRHVVSGSTMVYADDKTAYQTLKSNIERGMCPINLDCDDDLARSITPATLDCAMAIVMDQKRQRQEAWVFPQGSRK